MMAAKIEGKINGKSHLERMMTGGAHMIQETTIWILMRQIDEIMIETYDK